jgi:hypothetical protein
VINDIDYPEQLRVAFLKMALFVRFFFKRIATDLYVAPLVLSLLGMTNKGAALMVGD